MDFNWTIERQIMQRTWGRIRQLRVTATSERVCISGTASSYYLKQLALAAVTEALAAAAISPIVEVDIQVGPPSLSKEHPRH